MGGLARSTGSLLGSGRVWWDQRVCGGWRKDYKFSSPSPRTRGCFQPLLNPPTPNQQPPHPICSTLHLELLAWCPALVNTCKTSAVSSLWDGEFDRLSVGSGWLRGCCLSGEGRGAGRLKNSLVIGRGVGKMQPWAYGQ